MRQATASFAMCLRICTTTYLLLRSVQPNCSLKEAVSKLTLFFFSALFIYNLWKQCKLIGIQFTSKSSTYNLHCCRWHKFNIKALRRKTQYFYTVDSDMWLSSTDRMYCWDFPAKWLLERATILRYTSVAYHINYKHFPRGSAKLKILPAAATSHSISLTLRAYTPRYIFSSTFYPQSCWCILQVIHSL